MSQNPQEMPNQSQSQGGQSSSQASSQAEAQGGAEPVSPNEPVWNRSTAESGNPAATAPSSADTASTAPSSAGSADPYPGSAPQQGYSDPSAGAAYGQQTPPPYGQQTPPPYGQQTPQGYPQQGYDPNGGYQQPGNQYGDPNQGYAPQQYGQPGYPQQPYGQPGLPPVSESDEKTWAIISHISIPFFGFIGPLIAYLVYKDRSEWLKQVTTEALNFSILYSIAYLVSVILTSVVIGLILWPLVFIVALIFCIMGTINASKHEFYKYPVNVRFIK